MRTDLSEHDVQVQCIEWCRLNEKNYPNLDRIYAIPNGGMRNIIVAMKLKREGVRKGVPDLCLPVPLNGCHGLYIEMKRYKDEKKTTTSKDQKDWIAYLLSVGYSVSVCYDLYGFIGVIKNYYKGG